MTATATKSRTRKPRPKPERRVEMSIIVNGGFCLRMTIGAGEKAKVFGYFVHAIPADYGLGFRFEKFGIDQVEGEPSEYDANIDLPRGYHACTCKGNMHHGHCKHVEALLALIRAGRIDVPQPQPQTVPEPSEFDDP